MNIVNVCTFYSVCKLIECISSRTEEVTKTSRLAFLTTWHRRDPDPGDLLALTLSPRGVDTGFWHWLICIASLRSGADHTVIILLIYLPDIHVEGTLLGNVCVCLPPLAVCPIEFPVILRDSLEVLILNDNQLECVPQSVCCLKNLTELYLSK